MGSTDDTAFGGVLTAKRGYDKAVPNTLHLAPTELMRNPGYASLLIVWPCPYPVQDTDNHLPGSGIDSDRHSKHHLIVDHKGYGSGSYSLRTARPGIFRTAILLQ